MAWALLSCSSQKSLQACDWLGLFFSWTALSLDEYNVCNGSPWGIDDDFYDSYHTTFEYIYLYDVIIK